MATEPAAEPRPSDPASGPHRTNAAGPSTVPPGALLIIGLLIGAAFVVILNETVMANALHQLMADLGVDERAGQWLTTAFMLTMAVVIPLSGWVIQRFSTRSVFIAAMSLFSAGTLLALIAPVFGVLLLARVVQASGTAVMMPLLMTTILNLVPVHRRGSAMGMIGIVISLAPALGPTASGVILSVFGTWRAIFAVMLPIGLIALAMGWWKLVNVNQPSHNRLDVVTLPLAALGFGGLVYSLSQLGESGGGGLPLWLSLPIGVLGLLAFVARQYQLQRTTGTPLLDLRTFTHRRFALGVTVMVIGFGALMGIAILLPLHLQGPVGLSPLAAGLIVLPGGLLMGLSGPVVGSAFDKFGPRVLAIPGLLMLSGGLFTFSRTTLETPIGLYVGIYTVMMVGLSLLFTPMFTTALNDLPPHLYPHGSAWLGSMQQVGGAAGIALLVTISSTVAASAGDPNSVAAQSAGFETAMTVAACLALVALPLVVAMGRYVPAQQPDTPPIAH